MSLLSVRPEFLETGTDPIGSDYYERTAIGYTFVDSGRVALGIVDEAFLANLRDQICDSGSGFAAGISFYRGEGNIAKPDISDNPLARRAHKAKQLASEIFSATESVPFLNRISYSQRATDPLDEVNNPHVEFSLQDRVDEFVSYIGILAFPNNTLYLPNREPIVTKTPLLDDESDIKEGHTALVRSTMVPAPEREIQIVSAYGTMHAGQPDPESILIRIN